jgi:hypothetical protein
VARAGNGDLIITCTAASCGIVASSTQPTVFGKWADPRVRLTFGLSFSFTIELPTTTGGTLKVSPLRTLRVLRPDFDSMSIITDIAFFVDDLVSFFRGSRFVEDIQKAIAGKDFAHLVNGKFLDDALVPVNAQLAQLWKAGYPYLDVLVDTLDGTGEFTTLSMPGAPSDQLTLALIGRGVDRTGIIEGTIEWPRTFGATTKGPTLSMLTSTWAEASLFSLDTVSALRAADAVRVEPAPLVAPPEVEAAPPVIVREATSDVPMTPLAEKIGALALDEREITLRSALGGARTQLRKIVGTLEISQQLREIAFGTDDLKIEALMELPGEPGTFTGGTRVVSKLAALWTDDDETTFRRHFRLTDVATHTALRFRVSLGDGWRWTGKDFIAAPDGWSGLVAVTPLAAGEEPSKKPRASILVTAAKATAVAGIAEVALNPQPLPPKDGDDVSLNPQPLPPKWSDLLKDVETFTRVSTRSTGIGKHLGKIPKIGVAKGLDADAFRIDALKVTPDTVPLSTVFHAVSASADSVSVLDDDAMRSAVGAALAAQGKDLGVVIETGFDATDDLDLSRLGGILNPKRVSPTGAGVVYGIDFTLVPYVPPVVR